MKSLSYGQLNRVRLECNELVPEYSIRITDPVQALETGIGNCFAKAAIACGLIVLKYSVEPSMAYSIRLHGTEIRSNKPLDPKTNKRMAHITALVPETGGTIHDVLGLDFGRKAKEDKGVISAYNEGEELVVATKAGLVLPTMLSLSEGYEMRVDNWRDVSNDYLETLEREPLDADALIHQIAGKLEAA